MAVRPPAVPAASEPVSASAEVTDEANIEQALKDYCTVAEIPQVVDPSDQIAGTSQARPMMAAVAISSSSRANDTLPDTA